MSEKGLVFGKGFLGKRIAEELGYELSDFRILDKESLENYLKEKNPTVVINAIGKTGRPNVDWCESHKEETIFSNILVPSILASSCFNQNIYFVHIGSGCIYSGDNNGEGFNEIDNPNFEGSLYSRTKILSEKILSEYPCLQLRIRMPLDDRSSSRNFIDKIKLYKKLIETQNSMTTIPHFLEGLQKLISKKATGIYNFVNPKTISAVEVMNLYKEIIDPTHQFESFSLDDLDKVIVAKRSNCHLNTDKLKSEGVILPEINEAIKECLENYKERLK
ncbi:MAG: sugar nucleotide-binding protein [Nanoarchaeota archaeon]